MPALVGVSKSLLPMDGLIIGNAGALAMRALARAWSTRATAAARSKFESSTVSTIRSRTGSSNDFHHSTGS